jgi:UDP-glucose 4-epimerase
MHEDDAAEAIALTLEKNLRGVFNVAGPQPLPLSVIAAEAQRKVLPLPEMLLSLLLGRGGLPRLSRGALAHVKYPIVINADPFIQATGFSWRHDELVTAQTFADQFPPGGRSTTLA